MIEQSKSISRVLGSLERWFVLVVLAVSLCTNVYFGKYVRAQNAAAAPAWEVGGSVPALEADEFAASRTTIGWTTDKRPSVVYIFSPSCVWCARNLENIKAIATNPGVKAQYRFIGISLSSDGLKEYMAEKQLPFPVYTIPAGETFRADGTPETVIISPAAKVTEVWHGAFTKQIQKEVEKKLGVTLPGLDMAAATASAATHE